MKKIIGIVSVALIGAGGWWLYRQVMKLTETLYEPAGLKLRKLSFQEVSFILYYKIVNKSDIPIVISNTDLSLYINNIFAARMKSDKTVELKPHKCIRLPIPVTLTPKKLLQIGVKNLNYFLYDKKKVIIKVKGTLSASIGWLKEKDGKMKSVSIIELKKFPIEYKENLQWMIDFMNEEEEETGPVEKISTKYKC